MKRKSLLLKIQGIKFKYLSNESYYAYMHYNFRLGYLLYMMPDVRHFILTSNKPNVYISDSSYLTVNPLGIPEPSLTVPDFTIYLYDSSCNTLSFSCSFAFSFYLWDTKKEVEKQNKTKKSQLHELPVNKILKPGTFVLAAGISLGPFWSIQIKVLITHSY